MIAAIDVHYFDDGSARAGAVVFSDFADLKEYRTYVTDIPKVEAYASGQFYRRELPCVMAVLDIIKEEINTVIIDGYVDLGEKPGLGRHLWKALDCNKKIIGAAKTSYRGLEAIKVFRCKSRRPLYITSVGIESGQAAVLIEKMHGNYRIPTLLKLADSLCRLSDKKKLGNIKISSH